MELIYLYIEKYRTFEKAEFNFSSRVHLHYDEENRRLKDKRIETFLPENFWGGNIRDLMMIVGNNGAGKTSLMQFILLVFQNLIRENNEPDCGYGIMALREEEKVYYYECGNENMESGLKVEFEFSKEFTAEKADDDKMVQLCRSLKIIYLTNALSRADYKRNTQMRCNRLGLIYDCSLGGLIYEDVSKDANRELHRDMVEVSELQTYFLYEQYKQIKFVFDKNQYKILQDLKEKDYPVPLPQKLYINLLLGIQLSFLLHNRNYNIDELYRFDAKLFPIEWIKMEYQKNHSDGQEISTEEREKAYVSYILRYYLSRCCIWGMLSSIVRRFKSRQMDLLWRKLINGELAAGIEPCDFRLICDNIWRTCEEIEKIEPLKREDEWIDFKKYCIPQYDNFLSFVENEPLEEHFVIEDPVDMILTIMGDIGVIHLSISTDDAQWFMEFVEKYRYAANPDYFMDFHWGLSSGETNLLSTFASFYYIFANDYTNERHGEYEISNGWYDEKSEKCESVILLADEADLTFHPDWQRELVSLLTAFLTQIYPPSCCKNIQIIMSTHSPLLLGDIPQSNVIYLKYMKDDKITKVDDGKHLGTFGQNVYLLFKDSFFLEHGTMGRFAHNKIKEYIENLQKLGQKVDAASKNDTLESCKEKFAQSLRTCAQCAELVAEPIIRKKLFLLIEEIEEKMKPVKRTDFSNLSDEKLEEQLELLQQERNRRRNDKNSHI